MEGEDLFVNNLSMQEIDWLHRLEEYVSSNLSLGPTSELYLKIRKNLFGNDFPLSQQGKSYVLDKYIELFPENEILDSEYQLYKIEQYISDLAIYVTMFGMNKKIIGLHLLDFDLDLLGYFEDLIDEVRLDKEYLFGGLRLSLIKRGNFKLNFMSEIVNRELNNLQLPLQTVLSRVVSSGYMIGGDDELLLEHKINMDRLESLPGYFDDIKIIKDFYPKIKDKRIDYRPIIYLAMKFQPDFLDIEHYSIESEAFDVIEDVFYDKQLLLNNAIKNRDINEALSIANDINANDEYFKRDYKLEDYIIEYIDEESLWNPNSDIINKYEMLLGIISRLNR